MRMIISKRSSASPVMKRSGDPRPTSLPGLSASSHRDQLLLQQQVSREQVRCLGGLHTAQGLGGVGVAGVSSAARGQGAMDGDSPLRVKLAALKRGSDGGGSQTGSQHPAGDLAAALAAQTEVLKEALAQRGGESSITTVKTDLTWPTLTDDKSDTRDVVLFYEEQRQAHRASV